MLKLPRGMAFKACFILDIVLSEKPYEPLLDYSNIKKSFSHYMDYMSLQVSGENKDNWLFETCAGPVQVTKFSKSKNSKISQLANFTQRETNLQKITLKLQDILYFYKIKSMEI